VSSLILVGLYNLKTYTDTLLNIVVIITYACRVNQRLVNGFIKNAKKMIIEEDYAEILISNGIWSN